MRTFASLERSASVILAALLLASGLGASEEEGAPRSSERGVARPRSFREAKTFFQTNRPYDPRIAMAVDAVVVHRHGDSQESLERAIFSWQAKGYLVGRMFFADSDAGNFYSTGKWDGTPHPGDVERDSRGEPVLCAGVRPYMLPTDGWIRYLEEMALRSIDAGACAILPEEPLAHLHTGYEESFRALWAERYGRAWEPESASEEARFLTAQLKNELYIKLERRLAQVKKRRSRELGREIAFALPIHSLYSNVAARLVAPLGTSLEIDGVDGYVGQIWTGPVNWALANYSSPEKSFFASAYALYDYFVELTAGTGKRLWLLSDPVEDDPRHEWSEFERWYRHCVVAKALFPEADAYETMPWPDRIFLPGHSTGGGTPAPESYRIAILSALQAEQEMPSGGEWIGGARSVTEGVGVAVSDGLLWEAKEPPLLQGIYALFLPLIQAGVPVSASILERAGDESYMARFRAVVLSYEDQKPLDARQHEGLAAWVRRGGSLLVFGSADDLGGARLWWRDLGHPSPLHHLFAELGLDPDREGDRRVGKGWVARRRDSPRRFADPERARAEYLPLLDRALREAGVADGLKAPGAFALRRGPFVIAHAASAPLRLPGKFLDIFDPALTVRDSVALEPGESGLYRDVTGAFEGKRAEDAASIERPPQVLHSTHRLVREEWRDGGLEVAVRGPAETPAAVRIFLGGRSVRAVRARRSDGAEIESRVLVEGPTMLVRFPNDAAGVTLRVE